MQDGPGKNTYGGWPWLVPPGKLQSLHTQWTGEDHVGAPLPCPCTADPPQRVEVCGKWSQPILAADWPG